MSYKVSLDLEESTNQHLKLLKDMEERNVEVFKEHLKEHLLWSLNIIKKHARL